MCLRGLRESFLPVFIRPGFVLILAVLATLGLATLGLAAVVARRSWWLGLLAIFTLGQQVTYAVLNPAFYHWYAVVPVVAVCFYALLGLAFVIGFLPRLPERAVTVAALALLFHAMGQHWWPRSDVGLGPREIAYRQVAGYVRSHHPGARAISATEAGVVSFFVPLETRLVDLIGLTSDNPPYYQGTHLDRFFARPPDLALFHVSPVVYGGWRHPCTAMSASTSATSWITCSRPRGTRTWPFIDSAASEIRRITRSGSRHR